MSSAGYRSADAPLQRREPSARNPTREDALPLDADRDQARGREQHSQHVRLARRDVRVRQPRGVQHTHGPDPRHRSTPARTEKAAFGQERAGAARVSQEPQGRGWPGDGLGIPRRSRIAPPLVVAAERAAGNARDACGVTATLLDERMLVLGRRWHRDPSGRGADGALVFVDLDAGKVQRSVPLAEDPGDVLALARAR